jgi:hypothetical protein
VEPISDAQVRDWLLHRLDPALEQEFEQRLFLDADLEARVREAEFDLIDAYARGDLHDEERSGVARYLLAAPAGRQRLRIAATLAHEAGRGPAEISMRTPTTPSEQSEGWGPARPGVWSIALAAVALVAVAIGSLWFYGPPLDHSDALADRGQPTITLLASAQRGAGEKSIVLPHAVAKVRLQLELDAPAAAAGESYRIDIADAERLLFSAKDLAVRSAGPYRFVEVSVPTRALGPGKRRITLARSAAPDSALHWDIATR